MASTSYVRLKLSGVKMAKKAASYLNFSLLQILIDFSLDTIITIVQGDPDGSDEDKQDRVVQSPSQVATMSQIRPPPPIVILTWGVPTHPIRPAMLVRLN